MGQLGPPKPHFLSLDKNNLFHQYFLFRLGYPHAKFLTIWSFLTDLRFFKNKPIRTPFLEFRSKNLFHKHVLLRFGNTHIKILLKFGHCPN